MVRLQCRPECDGGDLADSVDLACVGPSPAINAYAKARGENIRIIAGAVEGGAALVLRADSGLRTAADFKGKKIPTPQLGNTQDIAAGAWLSTGGLRITLTGGDAKVVPTANPDQLGLFQQRQLDAVWTVEPWVSRLELEAGGKVLLEQSIPPPSSREMLWDGRREDGNFVAATNRWSAAMPQRRGHRQT